MNLSEATIMVVDDEPELLQIFVMWLEVAGCKAVLSAKDGKVGLALLETTQVDLLITDISMPVMDGITMVRDMARAGYRMPIIIFISGHENLSADLRELGVRSFLSKPVRRIDFLKASQEALATLI